MNILDASDILSGRKKLPTGPSAMPAPISANPIIGPQDSGIRPSQPTPVKPHASETKRGPVGEFFHDVGQAARAVGTGLYSAAADVLPGQVAKTIVGSNVSLGEGGAAQRYVAKQAEDLKRREMSQEDRENKLFGIVKAGTVQQGLQQIGNSIAPMVAGFGAGAAAASMVDSPVSPVADIVGGIIGAGALTAPMAYRASKADYVLQMRDAFKRALPNGTEEEWQTFKASIEDNAKLYGLWEAGPEVVGNMVTAGLIKTPAGSLIKAIPLIESGAARMLAAGVAKLALDMPVEVATESVTGYQQAKIEYESGLRSEPPTPAGAFVEAAPQTIVMTLATMGLGSAANRLMTDNSGQVQRHKIIRLLNKSGVGKDTISDLLAAKDWNTFNASLKKHEADISKVGAELTAATAGTPAAQAIPQDPNAQAINPLLAQDAAQAPSVFDVPINDGQGGSSAQAAPVNPLLAQNQPTTNAADAELVRRSMAARGEAYAGIRAVEPPPSAAVAAVKEVSDKIGIRVIWIDGDPVGGRAVQGAAPTGDSAIFLHTDLLTNPRRDPVMMVYAHELTHRSERTSPKDYAMLRDAVLSRADARASVEEKVAANMSRAAAESEAVAEQVELLGTDQAFWQEVFQGKDQSFIEHILAIIKDITDRVFGTNQAAKAEAIRGAAVQAFRALQAQGQQTTDSTLVNQPATVGAPSTTTTQEAANGQVQGQAETLNQTQQNQISAAPSIEQAKTQATPANEAVSSPEAARPEVQSTPIRKGVASSLQDRAAADQQWKANMRKAKVQREREWRKAMKDSRPSVRQSARARRIWDYDRGDTPVLNAVIDGFGGIRADSAKEFEILKEKVPPSLRRLLFPPNGKGGSINDIMWAIEDGGLVQGAIRADEVGARISEEISTIKKRLKEEKRLNQEMKQREADARAFQKAVVAEDKRAAVKIDADRLNVGDIITRTIMGESVKMEVVDINDDGGVVLDSKPFGEQTVDSYEIVHADEYTPAGQSEAVGAEEVPFSTKSAEESISGRSEIIEDEAERLAFVRSELQRYANIPRSSVNSTSALAQNRVTGESRRVLAKLNAGEIKPASAAKIIDDLIVAMDKFVEREVRKSEKASKAAAESRQQALPGIATSPYGTLDDGSQGALFSLAKSEDGQGREREFGISRFFRETLKREWSASYKQKSAQQAIGELQAITEKQGEDWVMDHLFDLSKETQAEFPMALRPLAARHIIDAADKAFRVWGINDDGSNIPNNPLIDKLWLKIEGIKQQAAAYEREGGRGMAWLRSTYEANNVNSPLGVRKTVNKLHDKLAAPVIGPEKTPAIDKALSESKAAYDEAISALEKERAENAVLKGQLSSVHATLKSANARNLNHIFKMADESDAVRAAGDRHIAKILEELRAAGMAEGLSNKPDISLVQKITQAYIWINRTADEGQIKAFLAKKGIEIDDVSVSALVNDARVALGGAIRSAQKSVAHRTSSPRKGPTVINRQPDLTIKTDNLGPQRLFDSGKMWGEDSILKIGEADAKRLALDLTEAGQTIMRGISSNVEVVVSNALRRGRNRAGLEAVLIESGIDERTAKRMARDITERRAALIRPALETLRKKYADKGDKVSRTIASAMDKIMDAMNLADHASTSQVSGFFDGNAWDESRRIIEEAFGFKSEITRDWFNETMRIYREYEKADEAGNHIKASELHRDLLNRVAKVQHGDSGTGKWMAVRSYIQGGMLSGPATHLWNFFNTASRNLEFAFVQSERQLLRGNFRAAMAPWMILGQSSKQAFGVAKRIMREGVNPIGMRGTGDDAKFGTDPSVASATEWHPWFQNKALGGMKYIGRALIAADALFRTNIENTEIYVQAYQDAINRGDSPAVASKQALGMVGLVTDGTNDAYNQASKKADELGLKGIDRDLNIMIDMRNALDPEMREKALLQGAEETFNDQNPEGLAGLIADTLRHNSQFPGVFWLGMFARIGANVFNYGLHTSPFAIVPLLKDATIGTYKNHERHVVRGDELVKRSIRAANGLALTTAVLAMCLKAAAEYDEDKDKNKKLRFGLTAKGPRNDQAAKTLWRQQNKPFTMTVNGKEYSYKWMGPFATPLAVVGAVMDEIKYGGIKDAENDEGREGDVISRFLPTMLYGMMAITTEELPGQGMVKFADAIYSAEEDSSQFARNLQRFVRDQATSLGTAWIPYSAMVRYLDRIAEPTVYTSKNMDGVNAYLYSFLRNVPIARKYKLYPMRNIFGEPIQVPDAGGEMGVGERAARLTFDRFLNNMQNDEDIQFLIKAQRSFKAPTREETQLVTNENGLYGLRKMNDAEYDRYLEIFGRELRTQIAQVRTDYSSTAEAEKWVYKENKSLQKRLTDAKKTAMRWAMYKFLLEKEQKASSNKD